MTATAPITQDVHTIPAQPARRAANLNSAMTRDQMRDALTRPQGQRPESRPKCVLNQPVASGFITGALT